MWTYVLGPVASLLPRRWRALLCGDWPVNWLRAVLISGAVEMAVCFAALVRWYFHWMERMVAANMDVTVKAAKGVPGEGAAYGMGAAGLISFALHPLTWVLVYFAVEGFVRILSAIVAEQICGTLPLAIAERFTRGAGERYEESRVARVADEVTRGDDARGWDLRVASCRAKPTWKPPLTVRYEGDFFTVTGEAPARATPERPFVYLLRRKPENEAMRGPEEYDPTAVLRAEGEPGFWRVVAGVMREKKRGWGLPLLADELQFGRDGEEEILEVSASRAKEDWEPGRIVRYAEGYYRIERKQDGARPRPYVYVLRRLAAGVPGRNVILYRPGAVT